MNTTLLLTICALLIVACVALTIMLLGEKRRSASLSDENMTQRDSLLRGTEELSAKERELQSERQAKEQEHENFLREREAREREQMARVKAETELESERRSIEDKVRSQEQMEKALREQFRNLAGDVLSEQSRRFKSENSESIDLILKPFKDNIREFRERIESINAHQNEQTGALKNELQRLMELNMQITTETTNLTNALRANPKVQGDWGEMILETLLENSNLMRGIHYQVQYNIKDETNKNVRPDVVVNLPGGKHIIIDSKVSLRAHIDYVAAKSHTESELYMQAHITSIKNHIDELSRKSYQQLVASPDFVIMFVPNEPAFLDALKHDPSIWGKAYKQKVIISSPTNLMALLKIVHELWQRDEQNRNQAKILKYSVKLYEQLVAFGAELEGIGTELEQAKGLYDRAFKRFYTGNDNIVRTGERLKKLGLKTEKQHSKRLMEDNQINPEELEPAQLSKGEEMVEFAEIAQNSEIEDKSTEV